MENKIQFFFVKESYSYRHEVVKMLPSLQILDDELTLGTKPLTPRTHDKHENINKQCPFDDDWQLINDLIDEGIGPPEEKLAINGIYLLNLISN